MFCYQQNFFTPTKQVDEQVFGALVCAPYTKECIGKFRETGDAAWKKRLPAFIFQATFDESPSKKGLLGKWRKQSATRLTGLVVMDIDHVENVHEIYHTWVSNTPGLFSGGDILLVYITPSGKGLKVVFKAHAEWGNLIDNQHKMAEILGVEIDEACKDASRMSFICMATDILYINNELFTYENKEFAEKFSDQYRGGNSQPTSNSRTHTNVLDNVHSNNDNILAGAETKEAERETNDTAQTARLEDKGTLTYRGVEYSKIIEVWLNGKQPQQGDRHNTLLKLASDLRYITDNNAKRMKEILMQQPWVIDLVNEGENLDTLIKSAQEWKMFQSIPKRFRATLVTAGVDISNVKVENDGGYPLPLEEWGEKIKAFFEDFPCLREVCGQLNPQCWPAALFTASAFMGTLMTRTWYYFYHRPEERRRLNYCIMVIGDPASGKSFATRLYKLLAAPIKTADKVGYDAINRYKKERQERTTSTKAQKGEALKKPEVIIRDHPARTSNATFIEDMNRAVEVVGGEPMHLHMLTFDTELDNATATQRGGSWIDKAAMELKAFHNEEDGQAYSNLESISGPFNVYWNFVYTGTPLSLQRKVSERNFGSGLATRLAVIPLPPSGFQMMELHRTTKKDQAADEVLKTWAFHLDGVSGELPLWPLVEHCWEWTRDHMEIAAFNDDKVDELLMKRVPYYGICVSAPFILMRHWEEWKEKKTFTIDDKDKALCTLALDIQYNCQHKFFGKMAQMYFDNMDKDNRNYRRISSKYEMCYEQLPSTFSNEDVAKIYGLNNVAARQQCFRLAKAGYIENIKQGTWKKLLMNIK